MFVLEDLWYRRITPSEREIRKGSHYQKVSHEGTAFMEAFHKELSPEGKQAFEDYYRTQMELWGISERDAYFQGIRFGVRLMLDVVGDYRSDLPLVGECV